MSIDLSRVTGVSDSRGVITEIKDSLGRVIWAAGGKPVVLTVEKITATTYVGETSYDDEQFILLDIYPKTNGTVKVTYGGLTKTIKDTSGSLAPNAQQVFFGTFNGVSDSVATPASGELTIEGQYDNFACGSYQSSSKSSITNYCPSITGVKDWGNIATIFPYAFNKCLKLSLTSLPSGITSIGSFAFAMQGTSKAIAGSSQNGLIWTTAMEGGTLILPSTIESIGNRAFASSSSITPSSGASGVYPCYLSKIKILATEPPVLGTEPFGVISGGFDKNSQFRISAIEVPKGLGATYKAADGWSYYANYIVEAS